MKTITKKEMTDLLIWVEANKHLNWGQWGDYPLGGCRYLQYDNDPVVIKFDNLMQYEGIEFKYLSQRGTFGLSFRQFNPPNIKELVESYKETEEKKKRIHSLEYFISSAKKNIENIEKLISFPVYSIVKPTNNPSRESFFENLPDEDCQGFDLGITPSVKWVFNGTQGRTGRKKNRFVPVLSPNIIKSINNRLEEIKAAAVEKYRAEVEKYTDELNNL